jgi:hypothetical protein
VALAVGLTISSSLAAQDSSLTILKLVPPPVDGTIFPFTIEGPNGDQTFDLLGDDSHQLTLEPGTYVIREDIPEGWELSLVRCSEIYQVGPVASGALRLALEPGASEACRFHNSRLDPTPPGPPGAPDIPALSPTALSIFLMVLSIAGGMILRNQT